MNEEQESAVENTSELTTAVETTAEASPAVETAKTEEPKFEYPKKFLKSDGTPDYERLAKSYVGLEKKLGAKPFIPAASADEYEWTPPENGVELPEEGLAQFKAEALEQGFTNKQYQFLMNRYNEVVVGMRDAGYTADKAEATLKAEWGKDFNQQLGRARAGFDEFAPADADPNDPVWNHPAVLKLLARMGGELGEDSLAGKTSSPAQGMTKDEILAIQRSKEYRDGDPKQYAIVKSWYERHAK